MNIDDSTSNDSLTNEEVNDNNTLREDDSNDTSHDSMDNERKIKAAFDYMEGVVTKSYARISNEEFLTFIDSNPLAFQKRDNNGDNLLHLACRNHFVHQAYMFRVMERYPETAQETNFTVDYPLHLACRYQYDNRIMRLIELYPEAVQKVNLDGMYPLWYALRKGNMISEVILKLIEICPEAVTAATPSKFRILYWACRFHDQEVVDTIIKLAPMLLRQPDEEGNYPIHYAMKYGSFDMVKTMIDTDRSIIQQCNHKGEYPLHLACHRPADVAKLDYILRQLPNISINIQDANGRTPLHHACFSHVDQAVALLLQHPDINVNAYDHRQETPLHEIPMIDWYDLQKTAPEMNGGETTRGLELLLHHPLILLHERNDDGHTPCDIVNSTIRGLCRMEDPPTGYINWIRYLTKIKELLEVSLSQQRWQSYQYLLEHAEDRTLE